MSEWSHIRRYNPSGPDYPEAGRDYVLRSEAEERIEAAEAKLRAAEAFPNVLRARSEEYTHLSETGRALDAAADELEALLKEGA